MALYFFFLSSVLQCDNMFCVMKQETEVWLAQAEEHRKDAEYCIQGSRYSLALYSYHQALEKVLKAAIVEFAEKIPPKSHNLDDLFKQTTLTPEGDSWYEDLAEITRHFWRARYPDYRQYVYTSKSKVDPTITQFQSIYPWVKDKLEHT